MSNRHPKCVPELTIVIPTYNESSNIATLIERLTAALSQLAWELIFIDDNSPDNTADTILPYTQNDTRIRCIRRLNRRGLSSACIEGFLASSAPYIVVMDADLQHDETLIPQMFQRVRDNEADLVIASRYIEGGSVGQLPANRTLVSRIATHLSRLLHTQQISDPMSGFFLFRRSQIESLLPKLYGQGFKILLDLLTAAHCDSMKVLELPYKMDARTQGASKMDALIVGQYLMMLLFKLTGGLIPTKFILFVLVGTTGVAIHLTVLLLLQLSEITEFTLAQSIATLVAMTSNFILNNVITYRDQRLSGMHFIFGLISFYLVCSIGALINISFAALLERQGFSWLFCGTAGAIIGSVWNYAMSSVFTWNQIRSH